MTPTTLRVVRLAPGKAALGEYRLERFGRGRYNTGWRIKLRGKVVATVRDLPEAQEWAAGQR